MSVENQAIFITGRFRSGTSFLWQLFDQLDGYCAWYEPLHPQLLAAINHIQPKQDHVGIQDYWTTYRQHPGFEKYHDMSFATQNLYLEANDDEARLAAYINQLIELSGDEVPVLQFNRVDFRLPWLRANFPNAKIIHIARNPLQLYHSQRKHINSACRHDVNYWDAYELLPWCYALSNEFPFLLKANSKHAFYPFYALYQLSNRVAEIYADVSINLDKHVFQSDEFIAKLSQVVKLNDQQKHHIKTLTHVPDFPLFNDELTDELSVLMTEVDLELTSSGLMDHFAQWPLSKIKQQYQSYWRKHTAGTGCYQQLLLHIHQLNSEMTRILAENDAIKKQLHCLQDQIEVMKNKAPTNHE
ncbi:sulfotransferase [Marinicella litoralis]|nr:sulfotransferase [Marinicella litoralis]